MDSAARVLVIEDDPPSLELALILLDHAGYRTLSARDGGAGLQLARMWHPDLVLCDIELPVLSGYDVARALRGDISWSPVPLVAVSAFSMCGDRQRAIEAGFDGYLPKPILPETFVREVEAFLAPDKRCHRTP